MNFGPFHLTNDISIGSAAQLIVLIIIAIKFINHLGEVDRKVKSLWVAIMGEGPQDKESFFYRFNTVESRVADMWERLGFSKKIIKDFK